MRNVMPEGQAAIPQISEFFSSAPPKLSQEARILKLLKTKGRATNVELNRICFRYGARIHDLRREGHDIVTNRLKAGLYVFIYRGYRGDK